MKISEAGRIYVTWRLAVIRQDALARQAAAEVAAAKKARIDAARGVLFKDGTMRRVAAVRRAIRRPEFHDRFMLCDRASAKRLEDLAEMAVGVLLEMHVDLTDVQLTMRRTAEKGLRFDPLPSLDVSRRALAKIDGQALTMDVPLDELLATAVSGAPAGVSSS